MSTYTEDQILDWLGTLAESQREVFWGHLGHSAKIGVTASEILEAHNLEELSAQVNRRAGTRGFPPAPTGNQPMSTEQPAQHVKKQWAIFIAIVFILLVGAAAGLFVYNGVTTTSQEVVYFTYETSSPLGVGDVVQVIQPCGNPQQLVQYALTAADVAKGSFEVPPIREGCDDRFNVTLEVTNP